MTVAELIRCLNSMDPEAEVHFSYDYGDHWRTTVAPAIRRVKEGEVAYSEYHQMPRLIATEDDGDGEEDKREAGTTVVILS